MVSTKILSSTTGFNKKCFLEGESAHYNDFWRIMWLKMLKIQLWRHKNNYIFIYIQIFNSTLYAVTMKDFFQKH